MTDPIRVGIVGVGWGALVHAPAFRAVEGFEVAALCARSEESVAKAGARLGVTDLSTDWQSFVRRDDLDLISIAAPVTHHVRIGLAALEAGKHVLCEKPASIDAESARELVQAAEQSGRATAMCFELRWLPHMLAIWELVDEGFVGVPFFLRFCQSASYWHPSHAPQSAWMYRRAEGGGYLMGLQSHEIDFVRKLFGEPVALCADVKTTIGKRRLRDGTTLDVDADDTGTLLLRLTSGASAVLSSSVVGAHTGGQTIEVFGADGTIVMGMDGRLKIGRASDDGLREHPPSSRQPKSGADFGASRSAAAIRATALLLEEWKPAFDGRPTPRVPSFRDGWLVQRVVDAARRSSEGAGWVELPED